MMDSASLFAPSATPLTGIFAEPFRSVLYDRFLGGLVRLPGRSWTCVLLDQGRLTRIEGQDREGIDAPACLWAPSDRAVRFQAAAGSTGSVLIVDETTLANAIGHKPEAAALRMMSQRRLTMRLAPRSAPHEALRACMAAILQEQASSEAGMETVIEAQIRILLVTLWRGAAAQESDVASASATQTLERFRQVLETHLRERWTVGRYCRELGIPADRLHDICTRTLGKPPQRLIFERLIFEAQALLERSSQTLDQIAGYLGFHSAHQFSAFFKAQTGIPPGAYRRAIKQKDGRAEVLQARTHADWP